MASPPIDIVQATASPLRWLDSVRVVLFDLDGTLHDDPRAIDHYVAALETTIPNGSGLCLRAEVEAVIQGRHPAVRPGNFAEPWRGLVLAAPEWTVRTATDWRGEAVAVPDDLCGPVRHDGPLLYLGDRWQIVSALALRRGADDAALRAAFTLARRFVNDALTDLARFDCLDGLVEALARGKQLLLATNTPEALGRPLVERLGVSHAFEMVRFDAGKPAGSAELIADACDRWGISFHEVVVIGDNLWNDLLPPARQGCRTVHIDPMGTDPPGRWSSARFSDLGAFAAALEGVPSAT